MTVLFFILTPISSFALNSSNVMLSSENPNASFGGFGKRAKYSIELDTTTNSNLKIYDKNKKLISTAVTGIIEKDSFPIEIKTEIQSSSSWRINLKFEEIEEEEKEDNSLLDKIGNSVTGIGKKLSDLNNFLTDESLMQKGLSNMKNSFNNLQQKFEPSQETQTSLKSLGNVSSSSSSSELEPINVEFAKGVKFNVFDLSKLKKEIFSIRTLFAAIIWIEFAMFCVKVIVPKFKV